MSTEPEGWQKLYLEMEAIAIERGKQLANATKQNVMLREVMKNAWHDGYCFCGSEGLTEAQTAFQKALASTRDQSVEVDV